MEKNLGIFPFVYKCWPPHFLCGIGAVLCQVVLAYIPGRIRFV